MPAQPSPRRRFQFRLRTLMIGVTLFCVVGGGYVVWQKKVVLERKAMLENPSFHLIGYRLEVAGTIPWLRRRLGDFDCLGIIGDEHVSDADLERYRLAFPEADVWREGDRPDREGENFHFPGVHGRDLDHLKMIYGSK
jgi:hypothetical protein